MLKEPSCLCLHLNRLNHSGIGALKREQTTAQFFVPGLQKTPNNSTRNLLRHGGLDAGVREAEQVPVHDVAWAVCSFRVVLPVLRFVFAL